MNAQEIIDSVEREGVFSLEDWRELWKKVQENIENEENSPIKPTEAPESKNSTFHTYFEG